MPHSKTLSGIKGSCFEIRIEYNSQFVIVHLPILEKFTKEIFYEMKYMLEDWYQFLNTLGKKAIWCAIGVDDERTQKLAKLLGFKFAEEQDNMVICYYGEL